MTLHLGNVPANSTLYIPFASYGRTNGESVTLTGLAVTDIEIYKNGSVTQRASDAGYALLDTDGIDFDGLTGIHGFSVDLSDNTDASFYAVGSFYWVVVSSVTIDSQTVNFIAATFRIVAAESIAGKPKADVDAFGGSAGTFSGGRPEVNTTHWAGTAVASANVLIDGAITAAKIAADAITAAKLASDVTTELQNGLATAAALTTVEGKVDTVSTNVSAVLADTGTDGVVISSTTANQIADAFLNRDMSTGTDSGSTTVRTPRQALRALRNKSAVAASTLTVYKEDDSTASWTAAVTGTAGADPITAIDPAGP